MRPILALLLLIAFSYAQADWVKVGQVEKKVQFIFSERTTFYVDPSSIAREGNTRRVWEIHDMSDKGASDERSVLASVEYDCLEKTMRTVAATGHSLPMASGQIIPLNRVAGDWIVLRAGKEDAVFFKILNLVCAP